jgi:WD40 repeat protein
VAGGKKLRSWEGAPVQHGRSDTDGFLATAFSPDGKVLALGGSPRLELRSLATGDELYPGPNDEVRALAVSADGREVAVDSSDRATRLMEAGTGRQLARIEEDRTSNFMVTRRIVFSADGKTMLLTDRDAARYLDAGTGKELRRVTLPDETSRGPLALSGDGRFALGVGVSGRAWVLDAATGRQVCELGDDDNTGPWGLLQSAAFSPDGKTVAVAYLWGSAEAKVGQHRDEQVVKVWDAATGKRVARLATGGPVAVAPGGKIVATVGDAKPQGPEDRQRKPPPVRLWDVATGKELHSFDTAADAFGYQGVPLAFSPDGKLLAVAGAGGAHRRGDATTGKAAGELKGSQGRVTALAFSGDGKLLASGGIDTTVLLWKVPGAR